MPNELPVLQIDLASLLPASEQIVRGLRATLLAGRFRPGDQLPSVRQLAVDLGVHHNTVAGAYRQLAEEGWLEQRSSANGWRSWWSRRSPKACPLAR